MRKRIEMAASGASDRLELMKKDKKGEFKASQIDLSDRPSAKVGGD
ncbi:hypothetical protein ACQKE0_00005 [Shewanella colwelliana]|nr:hypothetical protein [Shewanella colwelliana]